MQILAIGDKFLALRKSTEPNTVVVLLKETKDEATVFEETEKGVALTNYFREDVEKYIQQGQGKRGSDNHYIIPFTFDREVTISQL